MAVVSRRYETAAACYCLLLESESSWDNESNFEGEHRRCQHNVACL